MAATNGFTHGLSGRPIPPRRAPTEKPGPLCVLACRWCFMRKFWVWIGVESHEAAKQEILRMCLIDSRKELDTDARAAAWFKSQIREPFMQYLKSSEEAK